VELRTERTLADLLTHLYVLIPVLDDDKHYWVGDAEVDKLLRHAGEWLGDHPQKERIAHRYLKHRRSLTREALSRLTIEDETGVANLVVWPSLFERQRRIVLSAGMMAVRGKIQREGAVVHLIAHHLTDLSADLASVGERDGGFPLPHGRGDQVRDGGTFGPDQRDLPPRGLRTRDIYIRISTSTPSR